MRVFLSSERWLNFHLNTSSQQLAAEPLSDEDKLLLVTHIRTQKANIIFSFIHSFILETYIAPLQRRSQPRQGQRRRTSEGFGRFWEICKNNLEGWAIRGDPPPSSQDWRL